MTKLKLEFNWIKSENPKLMTFRGAARSESCGLILNFIKSCFRCIVTVALYIYACLRLDLSLRPTPPPPSPRVSSVGQRAAQ